MTISQIWSKIGDIWKLYVKLLKKLKHTHYAYISHQDVDYIPNKVDPGFDEICFFGFIDQLQVLQYPFSIIPLHSDSMEIQVGMKSTHKHIWKNRLCLLFCMLSRNSID